MKPSDLSKMTAFEISEAVKNKSCSAVEVVKHSLSVIEKHNTQMNAFLKISESALVDAEKIDQRIARGEEVGPLAGVPVGIKDLLCTKGLETTAASKILEGFIPPYSATVVTRLQQSGAVVIGKTNMDEFAMGSSNENSAFGPVKNPWDLERVPGGSSGGSAAAVAAGMCPVAIGTDTGGSIRQPANHSGIVGLKPTYGRVSRYGIIAFASSLDQAGPMTRTVKDAALTLECIAGLDVKDSTSASKPVEPWSRQLSSQIKGMRVGLPKEFFSDQLTPDTKATVERAIDIVRSQGVELVEVSIPLIKVGVAVYYLTATSEASSNLARYDGVRFGYRSDFGGGAPEDLEEFYCRTRGEGFGPEVKRRIILGTYALSSGYYDAYYKKACQVRRLIRAQFLEAFEKCDVLLTPVTTSPAFKIGERISNPLQMYMNDIFTLSTNLAGLPGISVPGGFSQEGLPIGVQLMAPHFMEQKILNVASAIEEGVDIWRKVPYGLQ